MLKKVSKQEFDNFIKSYPNRLKIDTSRICEPTIKHFYDKDVEVAAVIEDWIDGYEYMTMGQIIGEDDV
ncbi:hypothetical protein KAR91_03835 [Candidatus Pacearchaeota archaeon]|nr:hypothetical protein [Candidatus Pacearchaeota archaeon]